MPYSRPGKRMRYHARKRVERVYRYSKEGRYA